MINLKIYLVCIATIISLLSFCSCYPLDNHGFPKKVTFSAKGGSEIIKGDGSWWLCDVKIYEGKDMINENRKGTFNFENDSVAYEWLILKTVKPKYEFEIIATPNESHKKRIMTLEFNFGNSWGYLDIKQNGR